MRFGWTLWTGWCSFILIDSHTWQTFIEYSTRIRPVLGTKILPQTSGIHILGKSGLCSHPHCILWSHLTHTFTHRPTHQFTHSVTHPSTKLAIHPSTYLPTYSSTDLSTHLTINSSTHLSINSSTHPSTHPNIQPWMYPFTCTSI